MTKYTLSAFRRDEEGTILVFGLLLVVLALTFAGFAVDLMRVETQRAEIQGAMDNAVLAAADIDQKGTPIAVVKDYLRAAGQLDALDGEPVYDDSNGRSVSAKASATVRPIFKGYDKALDFDLAAAASNSAPEMEISLVLDISGSMGERAVDVYGYPVGSTRIQEMKEGANSLIDMLVNNGSMETTVTLVPFSEQVNIGKPIFDQLTIDTSVPARHHTHSYCVDLEEADFDSLEIDQTTEYRQTQHMQVSYQRQNVNRIWPNWLICPGGSHETVLPLSTDPAKLKNNISQLYPRTNTAIAHGLKWGAALLDPSNQDIVNRMIQNGDLPEAVRGRPAAYSANTHKIIVLLTDGANTQSVRIVDELYDQDYEVAGHDYWDWNSWSYKNTGYTINRVYWETHTFGYWRDYKARDDYGGPTYRVQTNNAKSNAWMKKICDRAKSRGIEIYAIGVQLNSAGRIPLQDCVSSPAHYFDVVGSGIQEAFNEIAMHTINLKLTQ